jgi:periplasmic protein TonB
METRKTNKHWAAVISMVFGTALVFSLVLIMNRYMGKIEKTSASEVTQISMVKQIKPEPKKEVKKVKPKKPRVRPQAPAPFQGLSTSLSGIDLGLFGFDDGGINDLDNALLGETGNVVMTEDLVDEPPKPVSTGSFRYPPSAKKQGIRGYVVLSVLVDIDGSVDQLQVLESNPSGIFDNAALQGVRAWHFEPAKYQGEVVKVWAKQKIRFDLS